MLSVLFVKEPTEPVCEAASGKYLSSNWLAGLMRPAEITYCPEAFCAKGWPVVGSRIFAVNKASPFGVKVPPFHASSGVVPLTAGGAAWRCASKAAKKNARSRTIRPPSAPPNCLVWPEGAGSGAEVKSYCGALILLLR